MIYFELGLIIFWGFIMDSLPKRSIRSDRNRKIYIIVCIVLLWLMAALRNIDWVKSMHLDAAGYASIFRNNRLTPWKALVQNFTARYVYRLGDSDIGYDFLNKIIGLITDDYNVFSLLADSIFFIPLGVLLYRYTTKVAT